MKSKIRSKPLALRPRALYLAVCLLGLHAGSGATPQGGTVVFGQATLQSKPNGMDIQQGTSKAIIDWNRFSLASGEVLHIEQPSASSVLLNRVVGTDPSVILGQIQANGRVFLSNPRGVLLGQGSRIDAGGFLATTLNLSNEDFLAGRIQLTTTPGSTPGTLQADGVINAPGGTIALVAPELSVGGTLQAQRVGLAAASSVLVDVEGDGLILFNARNDEGLQTRLSLLGQVRADGGTAELRAQARAGFADTVLNMDGIIQARSLGLRQGQVVIDGGSAGVTAVSGHIDVSGAGEGERGGSAAVLGSKVALLGQASVDASGMAGGGDIKVGGDFHGEGTVRNAEQTFLGAGTLLRADALGAGQGGTIAVWSDQSTRYFGQLSARGGASGGDGGFAEVSGKQFLDFSGQVDLSAALGQVGTLLLDPVNLTIVATATPHVDGGTGAPADLTTPTLLWNTNAVGQTSTITPTAIQTLLATSDVRLEASNNILISDAITSAVPAAKSLSLYAGNDISVNANINITGALLLEANHTFTTAGGSAATGAGRLAFGSNVALTAGSVNLSSSGALTLPTITASTLIATATTTTSGTITAGSLAQQGLLTVSAAGSSFTADGSIDLSSQTNAFGSNTVAFSAGGNVSVKANTLALASSSIGGTLSATASTGGISQAGNLSLGQNGSSFTASTSGQAITLGNVLGGKTLAFTTSGNTGNVNVSGDTLALATSNIGGTLTATASTGGISQIGNLNLGQDGSSFTASTSGQAISLGNVLGGKTLAFTTSGSTGNVNLSGDTLALATSNIGGTLTATASTGGISQTGSLSLGQDGNSFTASTSGQAINLANVLGGKTLAFTTSGSSGNVTVTGSTLELDTSSIGGTLTATASSGGISQTGSLSLGQDGSSFTASASGQAISLANVLGGKTLAFTTSGATGNVDVSGDTLALATGNIGGTLTATASSGGISQIGNLSLGQDGNSFTAGTSGQAINLANVLGGKTIGFTTSGSNGNVTVAGTALALDTSNIGGALSATATAGNITQAGLLTLGADGSSFTANTVNGQTITLTQANVLGGHSVSLNTKAGDSTGAASITSADSLVLGTSLIGGSLTAVASNGSISQTGALATGSTGSSFTASGTGHGIDLSTQANNLAGLSAGGITFSTQADLALRNTGSIVLPATSVAGKLVLVSDQGSIGQTGAFSVGTDGSSFTTSATGQTIALTQANTFGTHTVALNTKTGDSTATASITSSNGLNFAASNVGGALTAIATGGNITQTGALTLGADGNSFTANTATGQTIALTQANVLGGHTISLNTKAGDTTGSASISADAIKFAASSLGGALTATASSGSITQTGALTLGADGNSFTTATAGQTITLTQANVTAGHGVALHTSGSTGNASLTADAIKLAASTLGGKLTAIASSGNITQTGALTLGADGSSFTANTLTGQTIALTQANSLGGHTVALNTKAGDTTGSASITSITSSNGLAFAASSLGGALTAVATGGNITQTGALTLGADGNSFTANTANGQTIALTQANSFGGHTVALNTKAGDATGTASITADAINFSASSLGGALTATATAGNITQAGALTLGADGNSFTANTVNGQTITLTQANVLGGHSVALNTKSGDATGTASITSADSLVLAASSLGGSLTAVASNGNISQTGALATGSTGSSFTASGTGHGIDLSTQANNLAGLSAGGISFSTQADLALRNVGSIVLPATSVAGKLVLVSDQGSIGQTGAFSVGTDGSSFTTSATGQTIALTQANTFGTHTVALNTKTGDSTATASITSSNGLNFAASSVGGALSATASGGNITQTGALTLGADGNSFTANTATGQTITLTQANVLGGHTVSLDTKAGDTSGSASISADAIKFAASSLGGALTATASSGSITQTGALTLGADGNSFTTSTAGQTITLTQANVTAGHGVALHTSGSTGNASLTADAIKLAASTLGGKLTAIASSGNITQTGALTLGADGSSFTANTLTGQTIALTQANSLGGHTVALNTKAGDATGSASITSSNGLAFAASSIGGALTATATGGNITQTGALTLGADGNSFTANTATGQTIALTQANSFGGHSVALNTKAGDATGAASITADAINFSASSLGGALTATATGGNITQTGALTLGADGNSFTANSATGQTITLTQANALGGHTVALNTMTGDATGNASITSADSLVLAASSLGGSLTAVASNGSISQTGAITTGSTGSSFTASGTGHGIDLSTQANNLAGLSAGGISFSTQADLALRDVGSIVLPATSVAGKLVLVSDQGSIGQTGAFSVGADGSSFTTSATGQTIALTQANTFGTHTVALNTKTGDSTATASITSSNGLNFAASSVGGALTAIATGGNITQTGVLTLGADGNSFTANIATGQTITLTQANALGGHTVALNTMTGDASGSASITSADSLVLAASSLGGSLTAIASSGNITQTGALTLGADGSSFTANTLAGQSITLTQANSLGGHTVALNTKAGDTTGTASITSSDGLAFATSSLGGALTAIATGGNITQTGALTLGADGNSFTANTATGQTITLTQANALGGHTVALNTMTGDATGSASITSADSLVLAASSLGGSLTAIASSGNITQTGALTLGADGSSFTANTLAGQSITLTQANSLGGHTVALNTKTGDVSGSASITSSDGLAFATSSLGGALTAIATGGNITQTGVLTLGADGNSFTANSATGQTIALTQANALGGHTVALNTMTGDATGSASITSADSLVLAASSLGGSLTAVASNGNISQTGAITTGSTGSSFTASGAGHGIDLSTQANDFAGLAAGGDVFSTQADLRLHNVGSIVLPATSVSGKLVLVSDQGSISQSGAFSVGADGSSFTTSTAGQTITLDQAGNQLNGHTVALSTSGPAGDATLRADAIKLAASSVGGKLVATATSGGISQTAALAVGADGSSFTTNGQAIALTQANLFNGKTVAFNTGSSAGDVSVIGDALKFAASTIGGKLEATASAGNISQTGALSLGADGNSFTANASNTQSIALTQANLLHGKTIALHSGGDAALLADAINFSASTIGGSLTATANSGAISQDGALSLGADGSSFTTSGQAITLTQQANQFNDKTVAFDTGSSAGDVSVTAEALKLAASTIGGRLAAIAGTGSISQTGALSLGADGNSFTANASSAQTITLTQANQLHGKTIALHSGGDASLLADGIVLAASSVGGKLVATASTGSISQTGAMALGADGSSFTASSADQTIALSDAGNALGGHTVALHTSGSGGDASLSGDSIRLAASTIGGKLVASATSGGITQSGALDLGADGSSFSAATAGQSIVLTEANVFNGKTVALNAGGDASLNADAITLAASSIGGKLIATASSGGIAQTGALSLGADGSRFTTSSAGQTIALTQANLFGARTVALDTHGIGADASVSADAVRLAASNVGGKLVVLASSGGIGQSGAFSVGADGSSFTASAAGQTILLDQANTLGGKTVALNTGSGGAATLVGDQLLLAASSVGGPLTLQADSIAQAGTLNVGGLTTLIGAGSASTVTLGDAANVFGGGVQLASLDSSTPLQSATISGAGTLTVTGDATQLDLSGAGALVLGGGSYAQLNLNSGSAISQLGAVNVTGLLTLSASGSAPVNVDLASNGSANELRSVQLQAGGPGFGQVQLQDHDLAANGLLVTGDAAQLSLIAQGGATLGGGSYGGLSVDTSGRGGSIGQTGALQVSGLTQLNAGSGDVLLSRADNDFASVALLASRQASLRDANDLTLTQAQASANLTLDLPGTALFTGDFSGAGALVKLGSGVLLVNIGLSNLGGTDLQGGTLVLAGSAAHLGSGTLQLGAGSTLELRDGAVFANPLLAQGGLIRSSSGNNRMDGVLTLAADTEIEVDAGAGLHLTGAVSEQGGARALTKLGEGLLQLSGADTRSGATRIEQGQVLADGAAALSAASALSLSSGASLVLGHDQAIGSLSGAGAIDLAAYQLGAGSDSSSTEFAGSLSGTGGLSKLGSGTLTLSGSNTQSGTTQLLSGGLVLAGGSAQADNTALNIASGATLSLAADETIGALLGSGAVQLGAQRLTVHTEAVDGSFSGSIGGSGGFSKTGAGTQTLSGKDSWAGSTRVDGGRLLLASATALPSNASLNVASGALVQSDQALSLASLDGAGTLQLDSSGAVLSIGATGASSEFAGSIQGSGGLNKLGAGSFTLSGSNSFTGPVEVNGGTLALNGGATLADTAQLALGGGTTLSLQASETFARLTGQGQVQLEGAARLSLGGDGADSVFAGVIAGSGSLAKQGSGTLVLTGNNSYAGGTVIEAGTLQIGQGGSSGSLGSGAVDDRGLLRFARSDAVQLDNAISGSGGLEQTLGQLTLGSTLNSYTGNTQVTSGVLLTSGAERLPDASAVQVAAGASLTLLGNETLGSLAADGMVTLHGNLTSSGDQRFGGGLTISSPTSITLQAGGALEATSSANQLGSQALNLNADTVQLQAPQDLTLGDVQLAHGGQISAEHLSLQGALSLSGGSLELSARAAPDAAKAIASPTAVIPGTDRPLALAEATLVQADGSSLNVAAGATLTVNALGSVNLNQESNQIAGTISVLSGPAFNTAWAPNLQGTVGIQTQIRLAGQQLNIGGAGIEGDVVEISAAQLATVGDAVIAARLPYDNVASGTNISQPGLLLNLLPAAFETQFSFGSSGDAGIKVAVGSRSTGGRTEGPDSGFLTVRPIGGAKGNTAIFLIGPEAVAGAAGAGYSLFHDGAGKQNEVPVFYNNVMAAVPQLTSALSSVAAVSESARRDRFEEAVRTENVTLRLRSGVIAEVGPGRAATVGSGGVQGPPVCETLTCAP